MIKVLIVEDELPILRGIKRMIEKINKSFEVVKCAFNGKEAIEYLKENNVDVVITDINMPLVNGLEVLEFVSKTYPDCVKVIISGYNEFEYAQRAIHLGVKEYILKPIVYENLVQILNNICKTLELKREKLQKNSFKSIVFEENNCMDLGEVQIAYICVGPMLSNDIDRNIKSLDFFKDLDIENIIKKVIVQKSCVYLFQKYQLNERVLLIKDEKVICMSNFSEQILRELKNLNLDVSIIYHKNKIETKQIPEAMNRLRRIMQEYMLFGKSSVFEDIEILKKENRDLDYSFAKQIIEKEKIQLKEAELLLINKNIRQKDCVLLLEKIFKQMIPYKSKYDYEDMTWYCITNSSNGKELFDCLLNILEKNGIKKQETSKEMMKHVQEYIKEHFSEEITVASIAEYFGLVPSYLSRLFKEYSGYNLSQYIQKVRIDYAKKLLIVNEDVLAKDVAQIVGYTNPLYFSRIFKKNVGIYPSEYRKKMGL